MKISQNISLVQIIVTSAMCVSLLLAPLSFAVDTAVWPPTFKSFDKNGDQVIDPREFIAHQNEVIKQSKRGGVSRLNFLDFDRNNDSLISEDEYKAGVTAARPMPKVSKKMPMQSMPGFEDFDTNGDGKLLEDEFYQARNARMQSRAEQGFPMRRVSEAPSFQEIDRNSDGIVDKDEFLFHQKTHWRGGPRTQ